MHYFSDIDECQNKSGINCDQLCVNLPGSYFCDCNNGYKLNADGGTCDGKPPNFFYYPVSLSPIPLCFGYTHDPEMELNFAE